MNKLAEWVWLAGGLATLVYQLFFAGFVYTAWNWVLAIPLDVFLSAIWPIYWLLKLIGFG